jgi:hypothetical protein
MMPALQALAEACSQREDPALAGYLFARCDFCALALDHQPEALDMLQTAMSPSEYERALELHHVLSEMAYLPTIKIDGIFAWRIQYQGRRSIKSTPFFEFEYDERLKRRRVMRVKCASTNRLVPLFAQQPEFLQRDLYHHAHDCGGASCGWCKTRKGMGPSVLEYAGSKKAICWYMQRHFDEIDGAAVGLVKGYALLHEGLVAAE